VKFYFVYFCLESIVVDGLDFVEKIYLHWRESHIYVYIFSPHIQWEKRMPVE